MLAVDLRDLRHGPVTTSLEVAPDDPTISGLGVGFLDPVRLEGRLQATADHDYVWQVELRSQVATECRRCLAPVVQEIDDRFEVIFSSNPELLEDPSVYELPLHPISIDLSAAVREELALRIPAFSLCSTECRGLCASCGADLNTDTCSCVVGLTN